MDVLKLIFGFILMIPAITFLLMIVFICIACSSNNLEGYTGEVDNETDRRRIIAQTLSAAPSAPTCLDDTKIKSCSELIVVETNDKYSCSICLEEYGDKDTVRQITLCQHRFHAHCVDHWFQKHSTCPICRVSLLGEIL